MIKLGESFNEIFYYGDVLSGDDSSVENDDKDNIEKNEMNEIKKHHVGVVDDVGLNSLVLVLYEGDKFLGRVLMKVAGQFKVQYLEKPYRLAQPFEGEVDVVYYNQVYKAPVTP